MPDSSRVRVSIIGVVCVALFSALFARLWFLQMASADTFVEVAQSNSTRVIQTESPRGKILDRNGNVLVENSTLTAVMVDRAVPEEELEVALGRLAELFGASGVTTDGKPVDLDLLRARYDDDRASRFKPAIVAVDQPPREIIPPDVCRCARTPTARSPRTSSATRARSRPSSCSSSTGTRRVTPSDARAPRPRTSAICAACRAARRSKSIPRTSV
jgi:hypothetical protein